jgi:hypothetical protein
MNTEMLRLKMAGYRMRYDGSQLTVNVYLAVLEKKETEFMARGRLSLDGCV